MARRPTSHRVRAHRHLPARDACPPGSGRAPARATGAPPRTSDARPATGRARAGGLPMTIVDREAAQPPLHEPDVAAVEGQDVRLPDVHDAVIQGSYPVPAIRRLDAHAALLRSRQEDVPDGTIRAPAVQEGAAAPSRASSGQTIESRRFPCDSRRPDPIALRPWRWRPRMAELRQTRGGPSLCVGPLDSQVVGQWVWDNFLCRPDSTPLICCPWRPGHCPRAPKWCFGAMCRPSKSQY